MDAPPARGTFVRARIVAHLAPGTLAWAYLFCILCTVPAGWEAAAKLLAALYPLQLAFAALAALGGVYAFWLPTRKLRITVALVSLSGAMFLALCRVLYVHTICGF